jgi:hypothetical protein
MRTAIHDADFPAWCGCLCCGRLDADAYVPVAHNGFLCYRCVDRLHETRERNAREVRRMVRHRRVDSWLHPWRRPCHHR